MALLTRQPHRRFAAGSRTSFARTRGQKPEIHFEQSEAGLPNTHDSPLGYALVVQNGSCLASRLLFIFDSCLEAADSLADSFAEFRQFSRSEHEESYAENNQEMHGLKQSFKHTGSLNASGSLLSHLALYFLFPLCVVVQLLSKTPLAAKYSPLAALPADKLGHCQAHPTRLYRKGAMYHA